MPRAGGHYPDQAERAHRGPAQSRRHRQHHHAGRHSLRNELLHRPVDTAEEVQTHHQHLLRLSASCSKSHQCFPLTEQHVYTNKKVFAYIFGPKWSTEQMRDYQGENVPPFISAPPKRRTRRRTFLYFLFGSFFLLFLFLHLLRFLSDTLVKGGESLGRVLLTRGTVCSLQRNM